MMKKLLTSFIALALSAASAEAATTANSFITPQTPNRGFAGLTASTGLNTYVTLYTAGANGSRCYSISATSDDSVGHNVNLQIVNSGNVIFSVTDEVGIAAGSPPVSGGGPSVPMLSPANTPGLPVDQYGNQYIQLVSGDALKVANTYTAVSSGAFMSVYAICSDY